jgi:hypothetical protein
MYINYNANPLGKQVGDCVIRAISKVTNQDWETTYSGLSVQGYMMFDMPSANSVWGAYLRKQGFKRHIIPDTCPDCYTVRDFCEEHPNGTYLLALDKHVVAVDSGNYFDTWDSGNESPIYYFERNEE